LETSWEPPRRDEQAVHALRGLYERRGYLKYRMGKFEEYDFYAAHRDFLQGGRILTFTDVGGKLMALRPDVTMSIAKRTRATRERPERFYYVESIYRASQRAQEFREIPQVGVEYIGRCTPYATAEVMLLALKSLACLDEAGGMGGAGFVLDVSHIGFLDGMFEGATAGGEPMPWDVRAALLACVESKNAHELSRLLARHAVDDAAAERISALPALGGSPAEVLPKARALSANGRAGAALGELESLCAAFDGGPFARSLRLDFSIAPDNKYYNGLVLRGYLRGIPRAVMVGGRYDTLLRKMGMRGLEAIGFAVYFGDVGRHLRQRTPRATYDAVVLSGGDGAGGGEGAEGAAALLAATERLAEGGARVYVGAAMPDGADCGPGAAVYRFEGGALRPAAGGDGSDRSGAGANGGAA